MDNHPANPVFFSTFDPFDTPTPPSNNNINKSSGSLSNSNAGTASTGTTNPVNSNVLMPSASPVNNPPHYLPSPLDSPSINPYPLPRGDSHSSFSSHVPSQPAPSYHSAPSPIPNSYSAHPTSSSISRTPPSSSPSLPSQNSYPQLHQAPSPVPQSQPLQFQAPSPTPMSQPPPPSMPQFPYYEQQKFSFQPPQHQPPVQPQSSHPSQPHPQSQSQPQSQPTHPTTQSPLPSLSSMSVSQSSLVSNQSQEILEQLNKNVNAVMTRLDSIENRLSFLEITTKEVLNNQRTISTQQRKLQDSVDTSAKPPPVPLMPQHGYNNYEEPRKTQAPAYQPAPMPTHITPPGPVIMPPPTSHMPSLVPVTHIANRGEIDYRSSSRPSPVAQYDADLELAKKLQAEFDASSSSSSSSTPSSSSHSNSNASSMASSYTSKPSFQSSSSSQSKSGQQECPICQTRVSIGDLEAHVEQHFEDEEAKRGPLKPGEKPINKAEAKAGFFAKLFGTKPEDEKKPTTSTESTPSPAQPPAHAAPGQVPYTHTMNPAAYNQQRMGYYPNMPAASPGRAMYPSYYGYPVQNMPVQNMPVQNMPRNGQPQQQFLYYPNLDQNPPQ